MLEAAIERIQQSNPALNAVVIGWFDHARSLAADPDLSDGSFRGVPGLLKDLYTSFAGQTLKRQPGAEGGGGFGASGIDAALYSGLEWLLLPWGEAAPSGAVLPMPGDH